MPGRLTRGLARGAAAGLAGLAALLAATPARAHDGEPIAPHEMAGSWSWEPGVVAGLLVAANRIKIRKPNLTP